jgi:hypothetical protein
VIAAGIAFGILNRRLTVVTYASAATPAWTAPLIFEPGCLTVLGPCVR